MHFLCHCIYLFFLPSRNAAECDRSENSTRQSKETEFIEEGVRREEEPHAIPTERAELRLELRLTIRDDGSRAGLQEVKIKGQVETELRDGICSCPS